MDRKLSRYLLIVFLMIGGLLVISPGCKNDVSCVGYGDRCASSSDCCDPLYCDDEGQMIGIYVCQ